MNYVTMVARHKLGDPKAKDTKVSYTVIGDDMSIHNMTADKMAIAINDKKLVVTNMGVSARGLVSTNGALDRYTTFDAAGNLIGKPRAVILGRLEFNSKLAGYMVYGTNGLVARIKTVDAVELAKNDMLANGKIRHTSEGDIVSAIGGTYPLFNTEVAAAKEEKPILDFVFFGSMINGKSSSQYAGVIVRCKNANTISQLASKLEDGNVALVNELKAKMGASEDDVKSMGTRPVPGAALYGVYRMDLVKALLAKGKAKVGSGKLLVSCNDMADAESAESIVIYDVKGKSIKEVQVGNARSDKYLKKYKDVAIEMVDSGK